MANTHTWTIVDWKDGAKLEASVPTDDSKGRIITVSFNLTVAGITHRISVEDAETLIRARSANR